MVGRSGSTSIYILLMEYVSFTVKVRGLKILKLKTPQCLH